MDPDRTELAVLRAASAADTDDISYGWLGDVFVQLLEAIGLFGVGVAVLLENLFPPIPSELILPLAGFTASGGAFTVWEALVAATAGSLIGAILLYGLGAWLGRRRLYNLAHRLPLVNISDVEKTERWFLKYGYWTVFIGRMVPVIRSLISIPAGLERMNRGLFILCTLLGSLIWNSAWIFGGYLAGENWYRVADYADTVANIVVGIVVVAILCWIALRYRRNRRRARDPNFREESPDEVAERIERLLDD